MLGELKRIADAVRRRPLRHGDARPPGGLREDLGNRVGAVLAAGHRDGPRPTSPASSSWPRSTGTSSGRSSSRASTTPTTSGSTTASSTAPRGPSASTSSRASTSRTGSRASSRTTTSRARPRRSPRTSTGPPPSSPSSSPGLRFFHQGQREGKRVRIPVHLGRGPAEPPDAAIAEFYEDLLACLKDAAFRDGQLAAPGVPAGVGREPDVRRLRRVRLDRPGRPAPPRRRQLLRAPEPVLRGDAVGRSRGAPLVSHRPAGAGRL